MPITLQSRPQLLDFVQSVRAIVTGTLNFPASNVIKDCPKSDTEQSG